MFLTSWFRRLVNREKLVTDFANRIINVFLKLNILVPHSFHFFHYPSQFFPQKSCSMKKLILQNLIWVPISLGIDPLLDNVGHFGHPDGHLVFCGGSDLWKFSYVIFFLQIKKNTFSTDMKNRLQIRFRLT